MDVFNFAMQMEKDGEAYYRDLAAKTESRGLQTILTLMADEEVKHYNIFKAMNEGKGEYTESTIMKSVVNVFEEFKKSGSDKLDFFGADAKSAYVYAQEIEKKSEDLYREKAEKLDNEDQIKFLHKIADEEKKHWEILQNIIEMIDRPGSWLENAEWRHSEEY